MRNQPSVPLASISEIFHEEIADRSGEVLNVVQDETRLFARSVVPNIADVLPKDRLQGGVALRATESEVWLSPYVFRFVCSNGAIMIATATGSDQHTDAIMVQALIHNCGALSPGCP